MGSRPRDPWKRIAERTTIGATSFDGTNCIVWTKSLNTHGYPMLSINNRHVVLARWLFEQTHGSLSSDLHVDHRCHNADTACPGGRDCPHRACINVLHLQAVPPGINVLRGKGVARKNSDKTRCKYDHPLTGDNLIIIRSTGERRCRTCQRERGRRSWAKKMGSGWQPRPGIGQPRVPDLQRKPIKHLD
jgi:hypothetical protein